MSVSELLEARETIRNQLLDTAYPHYGRRPNDGAVRAELRTILEEIEAELAEQGYKDPEGS